MDGDESIPPSDAEEIEEVKASRTQYWESVTSTIKHNLATLWANSSGEGTPTRSALSSGERAMVMSPPRKRRKLSPHSQERPVKSASDAAESQPPLTPGSSYKDPLHLSPRYLGDFHSVELQGQSSQKEENGLPFPLRTAQEPHTFFPTSSASGDQRSHHTTYNPPSQTLESPSPNYNISTTHSELRELSVDPLLLFTPSPPRTDLPTDAGSMSPNSPLLGGSHALNTPPFSQRQISSSPLTPPHSPQPASDEPHSHVFDVYSRTSEDHSPMRQVQPKAGPSRSAGAESVNVTEHLQDMDSGRYSFRVRNARQKMPYRYEAAAYKQQMRSIPEAIVIQRNPQHSHRHDKSSPTQDVAASSDPEVDPTAFDTEDSDTRRRMRRRSKSTQLPDRTNSPTGVERGHEGWIPAFLQVHFSSSEDDLQEPVERNKTTTKSREPTKKKRRMRPFPMSAKQIGKLPAVSNHYEVSSNPSRHLLSAKAAVESSEDERVIIRSPTRQSFSHNEDPWSIDDPGGLPDFDAQSMRGPPTSSSAGRHSDTDNDPHHVSSLSPGPTSPIQGYTSQSFIEERNSLGDERSSADSGGLSDAPDARTRRQWKILKRVMPTSMAIKMLDKPSNSVRHHKRKPEEDTATAGHVRTRIRTGPRADVEIRGDSESSDSTHGSEQPKNPHRLDGHDNPTLDLYVGRPRSMSVISLSSTGSEGLMRDEVSDKEVSQWLSHPAEWVQSTRLKEANLVDYMLSGTRVSGAKSLKGKRKKRDRHTPKPRLANGGTSITTHGARKYGNYKQTHIPDHLQRPDGSAVSRSSRNQAGENGRTASFGTEPQRTVGRAVSHTIPDAATVDKMKERDRKRKKATIGTYVFSGNGPLASGRQHGNAITVDAEDELYETRSPNFIPNFSRKKIHERTATATRIAEIESTAQQGNSHDPRLQFEKTFVEPEIHAIESARISPRLEVDAGVSPLPLGAAFSSETYLGKGYLKELLQTRSGSVPEQPPPPAYFDNTMLSHTMPLPEFARKMYEGFKAILAQVSEPGHNITEDDQRTSTRFLRSICVYATWFSKHVTDEDYFHLCDTTRKMVVELGQFTHSATVFTRDGTPAQKLALDMHWTGIELAFRMQLDTVGTDDALTVIGRITSLMEYLWRFGFAESYASVADTHSTFDYSIFDFRLVELWVCLIHLSYTWDSSKVKSSFWDCLEQAMRSCHTLDTETNNYQNSELWWRTIIMACAISQFSAHGIVTIIPSLPPSWKLVLAALKSAPLLENIAAKRRRDKYIALAVNRCVRLHQRWHWDIADAQPVLIYVCKVFQASHYSDLLHENPEFPDFLCTLDIRLLYTHNPDDTAFVTLLKLVVQATGPPSQRLQSMPHQPPPTAVKQLLSLLVPVGSVRFINETPATPRESSMLINRFTAVAIALVIAPTASKTYVSQARRYVDFRQMDMKARRICIRGLMYLACVLRHFQLPLDEALDWLASMADTLVEDFGRLQSAAEHDARISKERVALCIHILLGSVRCIIDTSTMDKGAASHGYPDPRLLGGSWVTKVFASSTKLLAISATRQELIRLVVAFLDARSTIIPNPRPHRVPLQTAEESQESYDLDMFDYDDPGLAAVLGEAVVNSEKLKRLESETCTVLKKDIWPAVNTCVYADIKELRNSAERFDACFAHAVTSVECWVRCASVVVQNDSRERPWSWFFRSGIPTRELEQPVRSRIELHYKLAVLKWDPSAYSAYPDIFLQYLLQALVASHVTVEHDYVALVMTLDGLKHPLLLGLTREHITPDGDFKVTKAEFLNKREDTIGQILFNLDHSFQNETAVDYALKDQNQLWLGFVTTMFSSMKEASERLKNSEKEEYIEFCRSIAEKLVRCRALLLHSQDTNSFSWPIALSSLGKS